MMSRTEEDEESEEEDHGVAPLTVMVDEWYRL